VGTRLKILTALVLALTTASARAREQNRAAVAETPRAIGVVCEGGLLMPIAVRGQGAWRSLTDEDKADAGAPLKLTGEAKSLPRDGWRIVPFDLNVSPRALRLEGPGLLDDTSVCADQEGFRTDAPTNARARRPTDFIGIALMGAVTFERVETVQHLPDTSSRRIGTLITPLVQALEAERVEAAPAGKRVPSAGQRARIPVDLDNMWRYRHAGNDWYYFEAQKDYSDELDTGSTFVKGWMVTAVSGADAALMKVRVEVGNMIDAVTLQSHALGVLRVDDRVVWIIDERTYETRRFELVEIPQSQIAPVCVLHAC